MTEFKIGDAVRILSIHTPSGDRDLTGHNLTGEVLELDDTVEIQIDSEHLYYVVVKDNEGGTTWFCAENLELL